MSNVNVDNFKLSPDFNEKSWGEFKALLRSRYGLKVKEVKALYNKLHGNDTTDTQEDQPDRPEKA